MYCTHECYLEATQAARRAYGREHSRARYVQAERVESPCETCGVLLVGYANAKPRRFCGKECEHVARVCVDCGVEFRRRGRPSPRCSACVVAFREAKRTPRPYRKVTKTRHVCRLSDRPKSRSFVAGACLACGAGFVALAGTGARFCSPLCAKRSHRQLRQDRRRAAQGGQRVYRRKVFERDDWICRICRKPVKRDAVVPHPKAPTVDHILPLALGGAHVYENVQCAHFICNSRKSHVVAQLPLLPAIAVQCRA
jgi:5-methylcytosine-specific restriction endonuclease McrA